ncbi:MAG: ATP-binding cassette domain-containing protein [Myxococcota bacterium]
MLGALRAVPEAPPPEPLGFGCIALRGVVRRRDGFCLGPVDLEVRPGELVFLTGGNGAGKSTLLDVLLGLTPPDAGRIEVDGVAVTDRDRAAYRQRFAAVPTDPALVRDPTAPPDAPRWAGGLSRGQRKRAALQDAAARGKPALVLDEVAADQDPAAREHLYHTVLPALARSGVAVVLVTHDERFFPLADRLLRLRDGRLVPTGGACA